MLEVGNLMERITAHPFDQVTPEFVGRWRSRIRLVQSLRDCELAIRSAAARKPPRRGDRRKRVMIRLRWEGRRPVAGPGPAHLVDRPREVAAHDPQERDIRRGERRDAASR